MDIMESLCGDHGDCDSNLKSITCQRCRILLDGVMEDGRLDEIYPGFYVINGDQKARAPTHDQRDEYEFFYDNKPATIILKKAVHWKHWREMITVERREVEIPRRYIGRQLGLEGWLSTSQSAFYQLFRKPTPRQE